LNGGIRITDFAANVHVVVLDDDPRWTESVRRVLDHVKRPIVEARSAGEAHELIDRLGASLLVIGPSSANDLSWVPRVRSGTKLLHVIVVTRAPTADVAAAAFAAGATAVITDTGATGNLASALAIAAAASPSPDRFGLSDREIEILDFVTRGASNAQIARTLWVSDQTVKFHLSRIYKKLGVSSRTEAAWVARTEGLVAETPAPSSGA
jgi:DNA-binding NarL/FixJ family response regulator